MPKNTFPTLAVLNKTLRLGLVLIALGCVPIQQQVLDSQNQKLNAYKAHQITIDKDKLTATLNPQEYGILQSGYTLHGYGELYAGSLIRENYERSDNPIEVFKDHLMFSISYGGGNPVLENLHYELIWDGTHYFNDGIPTVDLIFSFYYSDMRRALLHDNLKYNLTPLQTDQSNQVSINFLGYDKLLTYTY